MPLYEPKLSPPPAGPLPGLESVAWRNGLLVRAPNWLGDTAMTLPAAFKLRRHLPPDCGLFVACPRALAPIWQAAPWVDAVVAFDGTRVGGEAVTAVRRHGAGVAVVFPNSFGSAWDVFGIGIPVRVGRAGRARRLLLTHRLPAWDHSPAAGAHQVCHHLELAAAFGPIPWDAEYPPLGVADASAVAARLGLDLGAGRGPWLALAPGAAYGPAKQWPAAGFQQVAVWWTRRGGRVLVVGTRAEFALAESVVAGVPGATNAAGQTSLAELLALLCRMAVAVANDSGTMHLAAALGVPGVAVFGSTDPEATGPLGAPWAVLRHPVPCAPCFGRVCREPERDYACLRSVTPEQVCAELERLPVAAAR